jgi:hypothetical protein
MPSDPSTGAVSAGTISADTGINTVSATVISGRWFICRLLLLLLLLLLYVFVYSISI